MTPITYANHVSRYCSKKQITTDGRVSGAAFQLREVDKGSLSINWLEKLGLSSRAEEIEALVAIYRNKLPGYPNGSGIAVLNVGHTKQYVLENSQDNRTLEFVHNENSKDSHASLMNIILGEDIVPELIAESVIELHVP